MWGAKRPCWAERSEDQQEPRYRKVTAPVRKALLFNRLWRWLSFRESTFYNEYMVSTLDLSLPGFYPAVVALAARGATGVCDETARALWGGVPQVGIYDIAGLNLEVVRESGRVFIKDPPPLLSASVVQGFLTATLRDLPLWVLASCDSTNVRLRERAANRRLALGSVVAAETQTHGRGRWGRSWCSPPFVGLWCSIWAPDEIAVAPGDLSTAVAVGAVRAIERVGVSTVTITWPNDLYSGSRKVGGILIERGRDGWAMGLGLNVCGDPRRFVPSSSDGAPVPASLAQIARKALDRNELLARLVEEIVGAVSGLASGRRAAVVRAWRKRQRLRDRMVSLRLRNRIVVGRVRDLDPDRGICIAGGPSWFLPHEVMRLEEVRRMS